jgi:hypothetical protein
MVEPSRKERELRLLLPEASERVNLFELYSRDVQAPTGRPFVRVNMVSTLDGAVAFSGRAGRLGGPGDKLLFSVLRSLADVVLVGAGTVRVERYGPPRIGGAGLGVAAFHRGGPAADSDSGREHPARGIGGRRRRG